MATPCRTLQGQWLYCSKIRDARLTLACKRIYDEIFCYYISYTQYAPPMLPRVIKLLLQENDVVCDRETALHLMVGREEAVMHQAVKKKRLSCPGDATLTRSWRGDSPEGRQRERRQRSRSLPPNWRGRGGRGHNTHARVHASRSLFRTSLVVAHILRWLKSNISTSAIQAWLLV